MKPEVLKKEFLNTPARANSTSGWKEVEIRPKNTKLVPLGIYASEYYLIHTSSLYFGEDESSPYHNNPLEGSVITMFVLKEVASMLFERQRVLQSLPGCRGMYLVPWDAWRSLKTQQALYNTYFESLKTKKPELDYQELTKVTQDYVSLPSSNPKKPSPHNTGGSIDITIINLPPKIDLQVKEIEKTLQLLPEHSWQKHYLLQTKRHALLRRYGQELNFGTPRDWGRKEAALDYWEKQSLQRSLNTKETEALVNVRLLSNLMIDGGFQPYGEEFWHYNHPGTQMGAKSAELDYAIICGAAKLSDANKAHEQIRLANYYGPIKLYEDLGMVLGGKSDLLLPYTMVVRQSMKDRGDIRKSLLSDAAIITA